MNVVEINPEESATHMTLAKYFAISLPLTAVTVWIFIAFQIQLDNPHRKALAAKDGLVKRYPQGPGSWQDEIAEKIRARKWLRFGMFSRLLWPFFLTMSILERRRVVQKRASTQRMKFM